MKKSFLIPFGIFLMVSFIPVNFGSASPVNTVTVTISGIYLANDGDGDFLNFFDNAGELYIQKPDVSVVSIGSHNNGLDCSENTYTIDQYSDHHYQTCRGKYIDITDVSYVTTISSSSSLTFLLLERDGINPFYTYTTILKITIRVFDNTNNEYTAVTSSPSVGSTQYFADDKASVTTNSAELNYYWSSWDHRFGNCYPGGTVGAGVNVCGVYNVVNADTPNAFEFRIKSREVVGGGPGGRFQ